METKTKKKVKGWKKLIRKGKHKKMTKDIAFFFV